MPHTPDVAKVAFGEHAVHVPAWLYVQNTGSGVVTFVGSSRVQDTERHPLRLGNDRTHQLVVGEIVVRPHWAIGTDTLRGHSLGALATAGHDLAAYLGDGEVILDPYGRLPRTNPSF
jgi:hypothetical protein